MDGEFLAFSEGPGIHTFWLVRSFNPNSRGCPCNILRLWWWRSKTVIGVIWNLDLVNICGICPSFFSAIFSYMDVGDWLLRSSTSQELFQTLTPAIVSKIRFRSTSVRKKFNSLHQRWPLAKCKAQVNAPSSGSGLFIIRAPMDARRAGRALPTQLQP